MVVPAVSVTEDGGYVVLQLVKKGQNERSVFVNFSTEGGSAKGGNRVYSGGFLRVQI